MDGCGVPPITHQTQFVGRMGPYYAPPQQERMGSDTETSAEGIPVENSTYTWHVHKGGSNFTLQRSNPLVVQLRLGKESKAEYDPLLLELLSTHGVPGGGDASNASTYQNRVGAGGG